MGGHGRLTCPNKVITAALPEPLPGDSGQQVERSHGLLVLASLSLPRRLGSRLLAPPKAVTEVNILLHSFHAPLKALSSGLLLFSSLKSTSLSCWVPLRFSDYTVY